MRTNDMLWLFGDGSQELRTERKMKEINSFIDLFLIDEYVQKDRDGYYLDVDTIPENDKDKFLRLLMQYDTAVRDVVHYEMQRLIDNRLPSMEIQR